MLVFAILLVVIGTIAVAIGVSVVSSSKQVVLDSPAKYVEDKEDGGNKDDNRSPSIPNSPEEKSPLGTSTQDDVATGTTTPAEIEEENEERPSSTNDPSTSDEVEDNAVAPTSTNTNDPPSDTTPTTDTTAAVVPPQEVVPEPACIKVKIVMSTTPNSNNNEEDVNKWSLTRINAKNPNKVITIDSGDAFPELDGDHSTFKHCVKPGVYTFTISDSSGDGLGANGMGGYYITANDVTLGISSFFFHEERMTFTLPFDAPAAEEEDGGDDNGEAVCTDDFFLAIKTDKNPEQTEWNVVDNDTGNQVLKGGPYEVPWAVYTRRACLPDGNYTFNMLDDGGDGVCCDDGKGFVFLSMEGETILNSNGEFGREQSTVFVMGGDDR